MKIFWKKLKFGKNDKGFSLVEVICAVAILCVAFVAIGGAMVVSAQNYSRGTYELDVQQEAQTTTNLIGNLLVDAVSAEITNADPASTTLQIKGDGITYTVAFDKDTGVLSYVEDRGSGNVVSGTLAENVSEFSVDLTKFAANKSAEVTVGIEKSGRTYEASYSTTARNGQANSVGAAEAAQIFVDTSYLVLEPSQTYELMFSVVGTPCTVVAQDVTTTGTAIGVGAPAAGSIQLSASINASGTTCFNLVAHKIGDPSTVYCTVPIQVDIRRVNSLSGSYDLKYGVEYKTDAIYRVDFTSDVSFPNKVLGAAFDADYKNPYYTDITYSMTIGDVTADASAYIEELNLQEDTNAPFTQFKLKQDMPSDSTIFITATSKHALGKSDDVPYNKTGIKYGTVTGIVEIKNEQGVIWMDNGLKRGNDYNKFSTSLKLGDIKTAFGGEITWLFRYRELPSGTWTQYYKTKEGGSQQKINALETYLFEPNKEYEYELMFACIDWTNNKLMWPHDANLLTAGKGFAEYGITQGWDADDLANPLSATLPHQYSSSFPLGKTEMLYSKSVTNAGGSVEQKSFVSNGDYKNLGIDPLALCDNAGSATDPFVIKQGQELSVYFTTANLEKGHFSYKTGKVEMYNGSDWEDVTKNLSSHFSLQLGGGNEVTVKINNPQNLAKGKRYRVTVTLYNDSGDGATYATRGAGSNISNLIIEKKRDREYNLYTEDSKGYVYFNVTY